MAPLHPRQSTLVPKLGTHWVWELGSPYGRALVQIDKVFWNGEEWWVHLRKLPVEVPIAERAAAIIEAEAPVYPNELDRFWESATPVGGRIEDLCEERSA